jgi:hypothetical protein
MRRPVHVQQHRRLLIRLGHDGVQVKFRPVERGDRRRRGELVREVVRVQAADMHQPSRGSVAGLAARDA